MIFSGLGGLASDDPRRISGLVGWWRSDFGITKDGSDLVSSWKGRVAGRDLTQGTGASQPLWVASLVNGHAALRFDGTDDYLLTAAFTQAQPFTIFMVVKQVSITSGDRFLHTSANETSVNPQLIQATGPVIRMVSNSLNGPELATVTTDFQWLKAVFDGTNSLLSINAGVDDTDPDDLTSSLGRLILGARNTTLAANVEIAEVLLYDSAISGANLTAINSYASSRYGLF